MIYINKKRFYNFMRNCFCLVAVILLCIFVSAHSGSDKRSTNEARERSMNEAREIYEYSTYELEYQTCENNHRIKEAKPVKVVYRYVTR